MEDELCGVLEGELIDIVQGGGGTSYYPDLEGLPSINGVTLVGDKTSEELGLVQEETDPTVPTYVKNITEGDINSWNGKATESYVNTKVAELVNSAPETLDTLGEVAKAIQENEGVVEALNSAIGSKADKSELPTKTSDLVNDSGFITEADIPDVDLSNYYTKDETYSKAEVDGMFGTDGDNLLKVSPFDVAESNQAENQVAITDAGGSDYILGLEVGKEYTIEYVVDGVTYIQSAEAYKYLDIDGVCVLGISEDMQSPLFTFAIGDVTGGLVIMQDAIADMRTSLMVGNIGGNAYIPAIELVSIKEKGESKYYTKAETQEYVKNYVDSVVGDINTALENVLGV